MRNSLHITQYYFRTTFILSFLHSSCRILFALFVISSIIETSSSDNSTSLYFCVDCNHCCSFYSINNTNYTKYSQIINSCPRIMFRFLFWLLFHISIIYNVYIVTTSFQKIRNTEKSSSPNSPLPDCLKR